MLHGRSTRLLLGFLTATVLIAGSTITSLLLTSGSSDETTSHDPSVRNTASGSLAQSSLRTTDDKVVSESAHNESPKSDVLATPALVQPTEYVPITADTLTLPNSTGGVDLTIYAHGLERFNNKWVQLIITETEDSNNSKSYFAKAVDNDFQYTVTGLDEHKSYTWRLNIDTLSTPPAVITTTHLPVPTVASIAQSPQKARVELQHAADFYILQANTPALATTRLYFSYRPTGAPTDEIHRVLVPNTLDEKTILTLTNLIPDTDYEYFLTYVNGQLIQDITSVQHFKTEASPAQPNIYINWVYQDGATVVAENIPPTRQPGIRYQIRLVPAHSVTSDAGALAHQYSPFFYPSANATTDTLLSFKHTYYHLLPNTVYRAILTEQTRDGDRWISRDLHSDTPAEFIVPDSSSTIVSQGMQHLVLSVPNYGAASGHGISVCYRSSVDSSNKSARVVNAGNNYLVYFDRLIPNTRYSYTVLDNTNTPLYQDIFTTLATPYVSYEQSSFDPHATRLTISGLTPYLSQNFRLRVTDAQKRVVFDNLQGVTADSITYSLPVLTPNTRYSWEFVDSLNTQLLSGSATTSNLMDTYVSVGLKTATLYYQNTYDIISNTYNSANVVLEYRLTDGNNNQWQRRSATTCRTTALYSSLTIDKLLPNSSYEWRLVTLNKGLFQLVNTGAFKTLTHNALEYVSASSTPANAQQTSSGKRGTAKMDRQPTYRPARIQFLSSSHDDQTVYLTLVPDGYSILNNGNYAGLTVAPLDSSLFTKRIFPTHILNQPDGHLYIFDIPANLSPAQEYTAKLYAERTLSAGTRRFTATTEVTSTRVHSQLIPAKNDGFTLLSGKAGRLYHAKAAVKLVLQAPTYTSLMASQQNYDYYIKYHALTDNKNVEKIFDAAHVLYRDTASLSGRLQGQYSFIPTLLKRVSNSRLDPTIDYYYGIYSLTNLIPNIPYEFELIQTHKRTTESSVLAKSTLTLESYTSTTSRLRWSWVDNTGLHISLANLEEFRQYSQAYISFRARRNNKDYVPFSSRNRGNFDDGWTRVTSTLDDHALTDTKNTLNLLNRATIKEDGSVDINISWDGIATLIGNPITSDTIIDWALILPTSQQGGNKYDTWDLLYQSDRNRAVSLRQVIQPITNSVVANKYTLTLTAPKSSIDKLVLKRYERQLQHGVEAPSLPPVSEWTDMTVKVDKTNGRIYYQNDALSPNSHYYYVLVNRNHPNDILWSSQEIRTASANMPLVYPAAYSAHVQLPVSYNLKDTTLVYAPMGARKQATKYVLATTPSLLLTHLVPNTHYWYQVVGKNRQLLHKGEFITLPPVSATITNTSPRSVSLTLSHLLSLGISHNHNRLSDLFTSPTLSAGLTERVSLFLEYRMQGMNSWRRQHIFVDRSNDTYTATIDNLLPNAVYEYRVLTHSDTPNIPIHPDQRANTYSTLNATLRALLLRILACYTYTHRDNRLALNPTYDTQKITAILDKALTYVNVSSETRKSIINECIRLLSDRLTYYLATLTIDRNNNSVVKTYDNLLTAFRHYIEHRLSAGQLARLTTYSSHDIESGTQDTIIHLTGSAASGISTFTTTASVAEYLVSDHEAYVLFRQLSPERLRSLSAHTTLNILLRNTDTQQLQQQTIKLSELSDWIYDPKIVAQVASVATKAQHNSLISLARPLLLQLSSHPLSMRIDPGTEYELTVYAEDENSRTLLHNDLLHSRRSLTVTPATSFASEHFRLHISGISEYSGEKLILFYKKHDDEYVQDAIPIPLPLHDNTTRGQIVAIPHSNQESRLREGVWYYRFIELPKQSDSTYVDTNIYSDSTNIDYILLPYNPAIQRFATTTNQFYYESAIRGVARSAATVDAHKEGTRIEQPSVQNIIYESNFSNNRWQTLMQLEDLRTISQSSIPWQAALVARLQHVEIRHQGEDSPQWYKVAHGDIKEGRNWYRYQNPVTGQEQLVYYLAINVQRNDKVPYSLFYELHFRLLGECIQTRVVARKEVRNTRLHSDPSRLDWGLLLGSMVDTIYYTPVDSQHTHELLGLGFSRETPESQGAVTHAIYHLTRQRQDLPTTTEDPLLQRPSVEIGRISLLSGEANTQNVDISAVINGKIISIWQQASLWLSGNLSTDDNWISLADSSQVQIYALNNIGTLGYGMRMLVRQNNNVYGFTLALTPHLDSNGNIYLTVAIVGLPLVAQVSQQIDISRLTWDTFARVAHTVTLATPTNSNGISIGGLRLVGNTMDSLVRSNNDVVYAAITSRPEKLLEPLHTLPRKLQRQRLPQRTWYDPEYANINIQLYNLATAKQYMLMYWVKGQNMRGITPYNALQRLESHQINNYYDVEWGATFFTSSNTGQANIDISRLALNTYYSYAIYDLDNLRLIGDALRTPTPILTDEFISQVVTSDYYYPVYTPYKEILSTHLSGWINRNYIDYFLSWLVRPFMAIFRFLALPSLLYWFMYWWEGDTPIEYQQTSLSDPLGTEYVPYNYAPDISQQTRYHVANVFYRRSSVFDLERVFGQVDETENSWRSRLGSDRLPRWDTFRSSITSDPANNRRSHSYVFANNSFLDERLLRRFIEDNFSSIRVGGSLFGLEQPGRPPELAPFHRVRRYSKVLQFAGTAAYLGARRSSDGEALRLYYLIGEHSNVPSDEYVVGPVFKGVVISFTIFAPTTSPTYDEQRNKIYLAVEGAMSLDAATLRTYLAGNRLDYAPYISKDIRIIQSYKELVAHPSAQTAFIVELIPNANPGIQLDKLVVPGDPWRTIS